MQQHNKAKPTQKAQNRYRKRQKQCNNTTKQNLRKRLKTGTERDKNNVTTQQSKIYPKGSKQVQKEKRQCKESREYLMLLGIVGSILDLRAVQPDGCSLRFNDISQFKFNRQVRDLEVRVNHDVSLGDRVSHASDHARLHEHSTTSLQKGHL